MTFHDLVVPSPREPTTSPPGPDDRTRAPDSTAVVVTLRGELDGAARVDLDRLLGTLAAVSCPVLLDVSGAWSRTGAGLRRLCRFRAARHAAGLACRLRGLHEGIGTDLAAADLWQVFAVWADTRVTDSG